MSASFSYSPTRSATFSFSPSRTPEPALRVDVKVFNAAGELVSLLHQDLGVYKKPMQLKVVNGQVAPDAGGLALLMLLGPDLPLVWDGSNSAGQPVESGSYYVTAIVRDAFGRTETWSAGISVIRSDLAATLEIFNSAGELVWSGAAGNLATGLGISEKTLIGGDPATGVKLTYGHNPGDFAMWYGTNTAGQPLKGGTYTVQLMQAGPDGVKRVYTAQVAVLEATDQAFGSAVALPGNLKAGDPLEVILQDAAPGSVAWGALYNLAGEKVGVLPEKGSSIILGFPPVPASAGLRLRWTPPAGIASGVYVAQVAARSPSGRTKQAFVKFTVTK